MPEDPHLQPDARMLRINDVAPDFTARTTQGYRSLSDYRGRWLILFSHPADFTPVCTSEFIALARRAGDFAAAGCDLMAVSVDSLYSHLAWLKDIDARFGVRVSFPVVEDPSMAIGKAYGMVDAASRSSATIRAAFVIDPQGVIRAIIWYPMNVGRSVEELLRLLSALQQVDQSGGSTPEGWVPGAPLLAPAATTLDEAMAQEQRDEAWYHQREKT